MIIPNLSNYFLSLLNFYKFIRNLGFICLMISISILLLYIQHEHELIRTLPTLAVPEYRMQSYIDAQGFYPGIR